jgi:hypothetical protein
METATSGDLKGVEGKGGGPVDPREEVTCGWIRRGWTAAILQAAPHVGSSISLKLDCEI